MTKKAKREVPAPSGLRTAFSEEDALVCLVLLLKGLVCVHQDVGSWQQGEALTGNFLEARYRVPALRFRHLLRRSVEHAENVKTGLRADGCGASFTDDPESMVSVLSADVARAEFTPHIREALVCLVLHMEVLAENVILSEDTWVLARLNAAKAAPDYGISVERFKLLVDGAMGTIARLRESNPFSAMF